MAHFQRFGPLAFRLAFAVLGNIEVASRVVEDVFCSFAAAGQKWPEWHVALHAVHRECIAALRRGHAGSSSGSVEPHLADEDEHVTYPASTVHAALKALDSDDWILIWDALMGNADEAAHAELAEALRRYEIAIANEHIPDGGNAEWPE